MSTPSISAVIRYFFYVSLTLSTRENGVAYGGFILTASHNPGGIDADFGVKCLSPRLLTSRFNGENGAAAAEHITNAIFAKSLEIQELRMAELPPIPIDECGSRTFTVEDHPFEIDVISSTEDYIRLLQKVFDFPKIATLFKRPDFRFYFDAIHGVSSVYAVPIFHDLLGAPLSSLHRCEPKPVDFRHSTYPQDFGGNHPDPNLTYAAELVCAMALNSLGERVPSATAEASFGCATGGAGEAQ